MSKTGYCGSAYWPKVKTKKSKQEVAMPVDSILLSVAVVSVFVIFAGVLFWGDLQTRSMRHQTDGRDRKHRAF
jgi:hypothetical protein